MSGHSKWSQIKRAKEIVDKKKSQVFGKLSQDILLATKTGFDPNTNSLLRDAITRARKANMPQENIDRLLERHSETSAKTVIYEGFGPGGTAFLITASTDNPNRTVAEIRSIFKSHNGQLGNPGSVQWKFTPDNTPLYTHPISPEFQEPIMNLKNELEAHNDIVHIVTDNLQ
jgi:YebC/PmpR family DNA-binding regulatory protein